MVVSAGGGVLKNVRIDVFLSQQAFRALFGLQRTDDFLEGVTKAPAKGRTFVFREAEAVYCCGEELKRGELEMPQRSIHEGASGDFRF